MCAFRFFERSRRLLLVLSVKRRNPPECRIIWPRKKRPACLYLVVCALRFQRAELSVNQQKADQIAFGSVWSEFYSPEVTTRLTECCSLMSFSADYHLWAVRWRRRGAGTRLHTFSQRPQPLKESADGAGRTASDSSHPNTPTYHRDSPRAP